MTRNRPVLSLDLLEDRTAPATWTYAAGTLTVTAANLDPIAVMPNGENVPGFVVVVPGAPPFDSGTTQPVRNLVVNAGPTTNSFMLTIFPGVSLTNLTVRGAPTTTSVFLSLDTRLAGNFTFQGHSGGGNDTITLPGGAYVGGSVKLDLGPGTNGVNLQGGWVGGDVRVTAGAGNDTVNLVASRALFVGGNAVFKLGAGTNRLNGMAAESILVNRNFTYTGGNGDDQINTDTSGAQLRVIGSATIDLGGFSGAIIPPLADSWTTGEFAVGRNLSARGALDLNLRGGNFIGGNVTVNAEPNRGTRFSMGLAFPVPTSASSTVIGGVRFNGGPGDDRVSLDHVSIRKAVDLWLGAGALSVVDLGKTQSSPVEIGGALSISSAATVGAFNLYRTQVDGKFSAKTQGGADGFQIDDSDFIGAATFDLGAGIDAVRIDVRNFDFLALPLPFRSRFQSTLTVYGRNGDDTVSLGDPATGTGVNVGGAIKLVGGDGDHDTLIVNPANNYLSYVLPATPPEDFEDGDF